MDKSDLDFKDLSGPVGTINEEIEASWCIISLAHDLGVPFGRITTIGESTLETLKKYGEYDVRLFSFDFPSPTLKIVENLIEILSLEYEKIIKSGNQIMLKLDVPLKSYGEYDSQGQSAYSCMPATTGPFLGTSVSAAAIVRISSKYKISLWESFNRKEHPILSCLLLFQNVEY